MRVTIGLTLALLVATLSCVLQEPTQPTDNGEARVVSRQLVRVGGEAPRTLDDLFFEMASSVPGGFGGVYFGDDGMVLLLRDLSQADAARNMVADMLPVARSQLRPSSASITVRGIEFDYHDLHHWFARAGDELSKLRAAGVGVTSADIDEVSNRIRVGVHAPVFVVTVEQTLGKFIPQRALEVFVEPPARLAVGSAVVDGN